MKNDLIFDFKADKENAKIYVKREFAAPKDKVWAAWTQAELLDQWWAPKPWKAETKEMNFTEGGRWLYSMVGPEGEKHWSLADFQKITPETEYIALDSFCDENGNFDPGFGRTRWTNTFSENNGKTLVDIVMDFASLEDLEKQIEMGFKEGFTAGLNNLDELLEK